MIDQQFKSLALAEIDAVFRLACHLSRSTQEAEDYVQETYLRAFRSATGFTLGEHGIRPWLFKILHNVIFTSGTRQQRERAMVDELRQMSPPASGSVSNAGGDAAHPTIADCSSVDWDQIDERLKAAVMELPMPQRIVFLLSALEALKYREIADVTGVPVGTVMSRLSRARAMLAARLAGLGGEHGFKSGTNSPPSNPLEETS